ERIISGSLRSRKRRRLWHVAVGAGGISLVAAAVAFVALRHPGIHSIAILPFRVMPNADAEALAYVATGLTDGIRRGLIGLPELAVADGASSEVMKDSTNLSRVANVLHVAAVLTGKVQRQGRRLRVTAEVDTGGFTFWQGTVDGQEEAPLTMIGELSR